MEAIKTECLHTHADTTPPAVQFTRTPGRFYSGTSFIFGYTCSEPTGCTFMCSLRLAGEAPLFDTITCPRAFDLQNSMSYTFSVYAIDIVGNIGDPISYTWTVGMCL